MMEKAERRRGIQSMEVGLRVLDALVALGEPSALGAIAQSCGLPSSQTHRYLASLVEAGMAQQDSASGRYDVGPAALRLGLGALARIDAFQITDTAISAFAQRSGRTVQIAALGPMGPTLIRWWGGRHAVMTSCNLGSVLPLITSATGQIFLAYTPENEIAPLLEAEMRGLGHTMAEIETIRTHVHAAGTAKVNGTMVMELRAAAFPIFDLQGRPVLSVTMLTSTARPLPDDEELAIELGEVCRQISLKLGFASK